jgi:hypothetical protein
MFIVILVVFLTLFCCTCNWPFFVMQNHKIKNFIELLTLVALCNPFAVTAGIKYCDSCSIRFEHPAPSRFWIGTFRQDQVGGSSVHPCSVRIQGVQWCRSWPTSHMKWCADTLSDVLILSELRLKETGSCSGAAYLSMLSAWIQCTVAKH